MPLLLLALFILVPVAELAVIIEVGGLIGVWPTVAILLADSVLGSWLMRTQGRAAWKRFTAALQAGRTPANEVTDGVLVVLGGALLLAPGFITDIFGIALLAPPCRAVLRRVLVRRASARFVAGLRVPPLRREGSDFDGTAVDVESGRLRRPGETAG